MRFAEDKQKTKAQLSNIVENEGEESPPTDIHFDDTQDLQVLQDDSIKLCQFLGMNRDVLHKLRQNQAHFSRMPPSEGDSFLTSLISGANEQMRRAETIIRRLDGTLELVSEQKHSIDNANT